MKKLLILAVVAAAAMQPSLALDTLDPVKPSGYTSPLSPLSLCADPTAIEYEGRMYVYGTYDQQEYEYTGGTTNNGYGHIKKLIILSSADMVNWTHHGTIDMAEVCGGWMWASWAPTITSRVESDGLTHFYLYFSNSGGGVGVITSTSPVGPWSDPLGRSLITGSTPGLGPCSCPFDPGVVIDDNGQGWLAFGGGDPVAGANKLQPGNARIVKLGDDMISLSGDIVKINAPYHFEANELNFINGKMVYTYCTGWSDRNDWSQFSTTAPAPSTCSMCYMTSDDPLNPDSWQWGGDILKNPGQFGYPWGNNHTHMHKFCGQYYMFYHTQVMENLAGITGGYRSIGVDPIEVDEENVVIYPGKFTNNGVMAVKENTINAFERQQAETMATCAGVEIIKQGNMLLLYKFKPGSWVMVKRVDFGEGANVLTAKIQGTGQMQVYTQRLGGRPAATLDFSQPRCRDLSVKTDRTLKGIQTVYFVFTEASASTRWDEWQFSYDDSEGITDIEQDATVVNTEYYTLDGRRIANPTAGFCIKRTTLGDGTVSSEVIKR